jgi:hypothetical protein
MGCRAAGLQQVHLLITDHCARDSGASGVAVVLCTPVRHACLIEGQLMPAAAPAECAKVALHPGHVQPQSISERHLQLASCWRSALAMTAAVDKRPDPFVLNSRGNVRASLGDWAGACLGVSYCAGRGPRRLCHGCYRSWCCTSWGLAEGL